MIIHQKEIQAQEKQYKQLANQLKQDQDHDIKGLREKLRDVENHHKLLKEEIKEKEKMNEENFCNHIDNLRAEHEKEIMRVSKSQHAKSLEAMLSDVQVSKSIKVKGLHGVIGQSETQKSLRKTFHTKEAFPLTSRRSHSTQSVTPPKIRPSSSLGTYK